MANIKLPIRAFNVEGIVNSAVRSHDVIFYILASGKKRFLHFATIAYKTI